MKKVTSVTIWNDSAGMRLSVTHSEIDETTHKVVSDNIRSNFILLNRDEITSAEGIIELAQNILDSAE